MKKKLLALVLTLVLMTSLVACGTTGSSGASSGTGTTPGGSGTAPDQNLVVAFNNDIQSIDPHNMTDTLSITVVRTMYEALVAFDDEQKIVPQLAKSWEVADDDVTYTFHLREGVKFHDGTDFNSAAFVANYDRTMAEETLRQHRRAALWESVEAIDDYTIVITLKEPHSSFLNQMTQYNIASPKAIKELGTDGLAKKAVGTGPYTFEERIEGDRITVKPYADYWGEKPTVNSLTFRAVPEDGSRVAMLQTGEADYIYPMPFIQAPSMEKEAGIEVVKVDSNIMRYLTLNTNVEALNDKRVRQAMNYAIDKEAYIQVVFSGYASEVLSCYPSTVSYYSPQTPYSFNLEKAKELMKEAGYEDGFEITMWGDNTTNEQTGMQFIQQQLAAINITVDVQPMDPQVQADLRSVPEKEATIQTWYVNWSASSFDADGSMRNILYSTMIPPESANTAYWKNAEFDTMLDEARATSDVAKQEELYADIQALVWEEAPWLFLGNDTVLAGQKTYVNGIYLRPDGSLALSQANLA